MRAVHLDVCQQGKVIAGIELAEMRAQKASERAIAAGKLVQVGRIALVGEELDAAVFEERRFFRQLSALLVFFGQLASDNLAGFHVGLVEGIDSQDRAGDRRGNFPAEEFLAQIVSIRQLDFDNRMAGLFESCPAFAS